MVFYCGRTMECFFERGNTGEYHHTWVQAMFVVWKLVRDRFWQRSTKNSDKYVTLLPIKVFSALVLRKGILKDSLLVSVSLSYLWRAQKFLITSNEFSRVEYFSPLRFQEAIIAQMFSRINICLLLTFRFR